MPHFIGGRCADHGTTFTEVFKLSVLPPPNSGHGPGAVISAFVPFTRSLDEPTFTDPIKTHMAENMARLYGVKQPGDVVEVVLWESESGSISTFSLPVQVFFASTSKGPEYIHLGNVDLEPYFDFRFVRHDGQFFLDLAVHKDSARACVDRAAA